MTTPTPVTDPTLTPVLTVLLECLTQEIGRVANPPATVSLRPGDRIELLLALGRDECCEGLAWVRVVNIYPSTSFPEQEVTALNVGTLQWAAVVELGAARCAPTPDANTIPTAEDWTAVTHAVLDDAAALRRTVAAYRQRDIDRMYLPGLWQPLTTEGGCVGGFMQVTVALNACDSPLEEP